MIPVGSCTLALTPPGLAVNAALTASLTEGAVPVSAWVIVAALPSYSTTVDVANAAVTPIIPSTPIIHLHLLVQHEVGQVVLAKHPQFH